MTMVCKSTAIIVKMPKCHGKNLILFSHKETNQLLIFAS